MMSNGFNRKDIDQLLADCKRRCCICQRFCGVKIETDHIIPKSDGGDDSIENLIPVCFECHAEIHSYNPKHPRGRKFTPEELKLHKKKWLEICEKKPEIFLTAIRDTDVGPLQSLIDELEFNLMALDSENIFRTPSCMLMEEQFQRATRLGAISLIDDNLKKLIQYAYIKIKSINQCILGYNDPKTEIPEAKKSIKAAINKLFEFLSGD